MQYLSKRHRHCERYMQMLLSNLTPFLGARSATGSFSASLAGAFGLVAFLLAHISIRGTDIEGVISVLFLEPTSVIETPKDYFCTQVLLARTRRADSPLALPQPCHTASADL